MYINHIQATLNIIAADPDHFFQRCSQVVNNVTELVGGLTVEKSGLEHFGASLQTAKQVIDQSSSLVREYGPGLLGVVMLCILEIKNEEK